MNLEVLHNTLSTEWNHWKRNDVLLDIQDLQC